MDPDQTPLKDPKTPGAPVKVRLVFQQPIGNPETRRQLFQHAPEPPTSPPREERKRPRTPVPEEVDEPTTPVFTRTRPLLRGYAAVGTFLVVAVAKRSLRVKGNMEGESSNHSGEDEFQESD